MGVRENDAIPPDMQNVAFERSDFPNDNLCCVPELLESLLKGHCKARHKKEIQSMFFVPLERCFFVSIEAFPWPIAFLFCIINHNAKSSVPHLFVGTRGTTFQFDPMRVPGTRFHALTISPVRTCFR
jgi:hypothetical protein